MQFKVGQRFRALIDSPVCIPVSKGATLICTDERGLFQIEGNLSDCDWINGSGHGLELIEDPAASAALTVRFKKLHPDAQLPTRAKPGDAGMDITCVDDGTYSDDLSQITYSLGLAMEIPEGYVGLLFPRSSICKTSLDLSNSVGVVDSGYRGEVKAVFNRRYHEAIGIVERARPDSDSAEVYNDWKQFGVEDTPYKKGDRVIQLVILPIPAIATAWSEDLSSTERGEAGFGSTGK